MYSRFKEVIPLERGPEVRVLGQMLSKTKFVQTCITKVVEFCQWRILVQPQTNHNCKLTLCKCDHSFRWNIVLMWICCFPSFITYRSCKHLDGKHTIFGKNLWIPIIFFTSPTNSFLDILVSFVYYYDISAIRWNIS